METRLLVSQSLVLRPFASKSLGGGVGLVIQIYILVIQIYSPTETMFFENGVKESVFSK